MSADPDAGPIRWGDNGLATVVTVDAASGDVLMVASMNAEALARTRDTGVVHYWSRSRNALWRKGETSGHEQRLVEIRVNCNRDSLLLRVEQSGAVCHDGYPTCYYRRLEADDTLTVVDERAFDPASVYGAQPAPPELAALVRAWYGAYTALRNEDHETVSGTSRRLRANEDEVTARLADELAELAGVLDGSHGHRSFVDDTALEAGQCLYWAALVSIRAGIEPDAFGTWLLTENGGDMLREPRESAVAVADRLNSDAVAWRSAAPNPASRLRVTVANVIAAAAQAGYDLADLIAGDLDELRSKPYLAKHFAQDPPT